MALGAYLSKLKPAVIKDGVPPTAVYPLLDPTSKGKLSVVGKVANGVFGYSVAMVPHMYADGRAGIAVGTPLGNVGGVGLAGGVFVYRFNTNPASFGLVQNERFAVTGETHAPGGRLGDCVAGAKQGDKPIIAASGQFGSHQGSQGVDQGSAYFATFGAYK